MVRYKSKQSVRAKSATRLKTDMRQQNNKKYS